MDFQKRFIGRQSYIHKTGNIIDPNKNEVIPLPSNKSINNNDPKLEHKNREQKIYTPASGSVENTPEQSDSSIKKNSPIIRQVDGVVKKPQLNIISKTNSNSMQNSVQSLVQFKEVKMKDNKLHINSSSNTYNLQNKNIIEINSPLIQIQGPSKDELNKGSQQLQPLKLNTYDEQQQSKRKASVIHDLDIDTMSPKNMKRKSQREESDLTNVQINISQDQIIKDKKTIDLKIQKPMSVMRHDHQTISEINNMSRDQGTSLNMQKNYYEMKHKGRKVHSLNSSIDYQNKPGKAESKQKNNQDFSVSVPNSHLGKKKVSDLDTTVIYDSNSTQDTPLKLYSNMENSNSKNSKQVLSFKAQRLVAYEDVKQNPIIASMTIKKNLINDAQSEKQPTQVSYYHLMSLNNDRYSSGAYSPTSDKTYNGSIHGDSFYMKFQQFKNKIGTHSMVSTADKDGESAQKTAQFGEFGNENSPTKLPLIQKQSQSMNVRSNQGSNSFQAQAKQTFSAPNQLNNPRQDTILTINNISASSGQISSQKNSNIQIYGKVVKRRNIYQANSNNEKNLQQSFNDHSGQYQSDSLNQTVQLKKQAQSRVQLHSLNNSINLQNDLELIKLKQQEDQVRQINSIKKSYSPYRMKEYLEMQNQYQSKYKKLGGLGPNIGDNEWQERKLKKEKINQYVNQLKYKQISEL
ncbi:UNKNOWN [Stylonychia lemnae]|uniref:Uncharacterized protein n=1 Tax=Stylonychia lemnae TaxID=5949 RepID=A0A078A2Q1_STYLE|nr:UNKNOWN [Stylonychia lemnae]|eukprot:CDW76375.1 UNKNOWN [Stylonychia lemnae]